MHINLNGNMLKNRYLEIENECGVDESGAGPAFGSVVAASVIMPVDWSNKILNDSKKVSEKNREKLFDIIIKECISYSISESSVEEIEEINILQARFLAMDRAINSMNVKPEHLIIDGNRFYKDYHIPYNCIIKGDGLYTSIAAASILAKVYRDMTITSLSKTYDKWDLQNNKGYLTKKHIELIREHGLSNLHRPKFCRKLFSVV
jgi:ribonuclease HII